MKNVDEHPMRLALQSALVGIKENAGGPFGACIVRDNQIIAVAHNTVIKDGDPTCHAEMNAIRLAAKACGSHVLSDCEIFTIAEPCPMCLAAIYWARIKQIYVGVDKAVSARFGFDDAVFYQQLNQAVTDRRVPCHTGMLTTEIEEVFQQWQDLNRPLY